MLLNRLIWIYCKLLMSFLVFQATRIHQLLDQDWILFLSDRALISIQV